MIISVNLGNHSYDVVVRRGLLNEVGSHLDLNRRVLIVTDSGVPQEYARTVAEACLSPRIVTVPEGEQSKSIANWERLCTAMLEHGMTRTDCVVAVGGGVVGDLAGFAAASFMRGIDFYNIPTTVLSQVDSSIGGKVAVDLAGIKNCVGAFHQPKKVLVDPNVLRTLPPRQISNGLAEAVKMALTFDKDLFERIEQAADPFADIEHIIARSLQLKAAVVEEDETETGLRKVLNFGHTVGHGIETEEGLSGLYHGECVALGMLTMCAPTVKNRLLRVLETLQLPTSLNYDPERIWQAMCHDKKKAGNQFTVVYVPSVGSYELRTVSESDLRQTLKEALTQ